MLASPTGTLLRAQDVGGLGKISPNLVRGEDGKERRDRREAIRPGRGVATVLDLEGRGPDPLGRGAGSPSAPPEHRARAL